MLDWVITTVQPSFMQFSLLLVLFLYQFSLCNVIYEIRKTHPGLFFLFGKLGFLFYMLYLFFLIFCIHYLFILLVLMRIVKYFVCLFEDCSRFYVQTNNSTD